MNAKGELSKRAGTVARWFGVDREVQSALVPREVNAPDVRPAGGQIILLTGPSGAGKSTLLRRIRQSAGGSMRWIDLGKIVLPRAAVIDVMVEAMTPKVIEGEWGEAREEQMIVEGLRALSRVGLGEVWTYLRTPAQLSEGQRWRLRLAIAMARGVNPRNELHGLSKNLVVLGVDEFCAPLDLVTALVVARGVRKAVDLRGDFCAVVATSREDLREALMPDLEVRCDFGVYEFRRGK